MPGVPNLDQKAKGRPQTYRNAPRMVQKDHACFGPRSQQHDDTRADRGGEVGGVDHGPATRAPVAVRPTDHLPEGSQRRDSGDGPIRSGIRFVRIVALGFVRRSQEDRDLRPTF